MDAATAVALTAALLAAIIAVTVPWMTFRLALHQDQVRWIRERRSELYVDMLAEVYAEQEWLKLETAPEATQERARKYFTDKRLPPAERARLGARGTIFGSRAVNRHFNEVDAEASRLLMARRIGNDPESVQFLIDVRLSMLIDGLQEAIRRELGADRIPLDGGPVTEPAVNGTWIPRPGGLPPFMSDDDEDTGTAPSAQPARGDEEG